MDPFVALFGEKLVSKDGEVSTEETLKGKVVGIYFSAHWCPPCRTFTPELSKTYLKLADKNFEIVFVSSDNDLAGFDEYYSEMPWKALPYSDRARKSALSSKFKVSGIPTLVILKEDGTVITKDGRTEVDSDPEGAKFPWVPPEVKDVIGTEFINRDGNITTLSDLEGKYIGIYFSAHWCPPCKGFTPNLAKLYEKLKAKDANFEIIFASSDKDQKQFDEYYAEMPWLAIPFEDRQRKTNLSQKFGVTGIPCLVILDKDLNVVNTNARLRASNDPEGVDFPWGVKPLINLDEDPTNINDYPSIFFVKGDLAEGDVTAVMDEMTKQGQECIDKAKQKKDDPEFMFFFSDTRAGKISSQLISAMELPDSDSSKPLIGLIDIPDAGKYFMQSDCDVPTPDIVKGLIASYRAKALTMKQLQ